MVRFKNGKPSAIWYSQHASGEALIYSIVEKHGVRPISYSAKGTHANYAAAGTHSHAIPNFNLPIGVLMDLCDRGHLWDPTLSAYIYKYDAATNHFTPYNGSDPTGCLYFLGHWGDENYPLSDPKQHGKNIGDHLKYEGGPTGPIDKQLNRKDVWPKGAWGEHIWKLMPWA